MAETPLNSYNVISIISRSRRFSLYQAESIANGRQVLIKTPDSLRIKDAELAKALLKEAEIHLQLSHPGIRAGFEARDENGIVYLIGEYIEGESLARYLSSNDSTANPLQNLVWLTQLLEAISYAHSLEIMHLNLNPYNILLDKQGQLRIIGFGKPKNAWLNGEEGIGTYHPILYTAAELFQAGIALPASDQYSWAVIAYQLFCGVLPWRVDLLLSPEKQKQQAVCRAVIMPEVLKREMPDWLFATLLQCLKLDPHQRFASTAELLKVLKQNTLEEMVAEPEEQIIIEPEPDNPLLEPELTEAAEPEPKPVTAPETESELMETAEPEPEIPIAEPEEHKAAESVPEIPKAEPEKPKTAEPETELESALTEPDIAETSAPASENALADTEHARVDLTREPEDSLLGLLDDSDAPAYEVVVPSEPDYLFSEEAVMEPVEVAETPAPKPRESQSVPANANSPLQSGASASAATPQSVPANANSPLQSSASASAATPRPQDSTNLKKTFKYLFWASVVILLFVVIKYIAFSPRSKLQNTSDSLEVSLAEEHPKEENLPIEMVKVPGDTLVMGSLDPLADEDEFPLLTLSVPSFWMAKTEVTQKEWLMVFSENPSQHKDDKLPVENVSFYDVIEFCNAKSQKDGLTPCYDYFDTEVVCNFEANGYRLPTEAEWEWAAKSAKRRDYLTYSGSEQADEVGWHNGNSDATSHPVGQKKPNQLGLYDLSGNLYEWVWNWYAPYSYRMVDQFKGPANGTDKVIRGGSWYHPSSDLRVTGRSYAKPFQKSAYLGFRVVRSGAIE